MAFETTFRRLSGGSLIAKNLQDGRGSPLTATTALVRVRVAESSTGDEVLPTQNMFYDSPGQWHIDFPALLLVGGRNLVATVSQYDSTGASLENTLVMLLRDHGL